MSKTVKIILVVAAILVILGITYYLMFAKPKPGNGGSTINITPGGQYESGTGATGGTGTGLIGGG